MGTKNGTVETTVDARERGGGGKQEMHFSVLLAPLPYLKNNAKPTKREETKRAKAAEDQENREITRVH